MPPLRPAPFGMPVTPEEAALLLGPYGDAELLRFLVAKLGVPEVAPDRWDYADFGGMHFALSPWMPRRVPAMSGSAQPAT